MPEAFYQDFLQERKKSGRFRSLRSMGPTRGGRTRLGRKTLVNFSSNNYLGLAEHQELNRRARAWTREWGTGATASRLVCGNLEIFEQVEGRLAHGKGTEAGLLFSSGFQANASLLPALFDGKVLGADPLVFTDKLNHASLHHGCKVAGVKQIRYHHNDLGHLESLLKKQGDAARSKFIVTESVFSMDGDRVDMAELVRLKEEHNAFLMVDEAHAMGILGINGFGMAADYPGRIDLVMGTFSKALGGFGAYVGCSKILKDYLINRADGFIYTTALPPAVLGAMDAALELLPSLWWERQTLLNNAEKVRKAFQAAGLDTLNSSTQIIPVVTGSERAALEAARALEKEGILGVAIRPPTVPEGTSRLRFSLTAAHDIEDVEQLIEAVIRLLGKRGAS